MPLKKEQPTAKTEPEKLKIIILEEGNTNPYPVAACCNAMTYCIKQP